MSGREIKCGYGWHAPVCNGADCKCQCHRPTEPLPLGTHEPKWALTGRTDPRYYIYECRVPGCHREQWVRIGEQSFPSLAEHGPANRKTLFAVTAPVIRNRRRIIRSWRAWFRGDPR